MSKRQRTPLRASFLSSSLFAVIGAAAWLLAGLGPQCSSDTNHPPFLDGDAGAVDEGSPPPVVGSGNGTSGSTGNGGTSNTGPVGSGGIVGASGALGSSGMFGASGGTGLTTGGVIGNGAGFGGAFGTGLGGASGAFNGSFPSNGGAFP